MSTTSMAGSSTTSCHRVVWAAKPKRSAASVTALSVRPARVCSRGVSGSSTKRWAVRQAWEGAAPMKPYPIMPTVNGAEDGGGGGGRQQLPPASADGQGGG